MKHKIDGFIVWDGFLAQCYGDKSPFRFVTYEPRPSGDQILVSPASIEVEVPDDFNPTAGQIASLTAQRQEITAEFTKKLAQVDHEIGKLLSLEHKQ